MTRRQSTARRVRPEQVSGPVCATGTVSAPEDAPPEQPDSDTGLSREAVLTGAAVVGGYLLTR